MQTIADLYYPIIAMEGGKIISAVTSVILVWPEWNKDYTEIMFWCEGAIETGDDVNRRADNGQIVNYGYNVKSAGTDAIKKALNTYLRISADVYDKKSPLVPPLAIKRVEEKLAEGKEMSLAEAKAWIMIKENNLTVNSRNFLKFLGKYLKGS